MMRARLLIRQEDGSTGYIIWKAVTVLGRSQECDVAISDKGASRQHCEIRRDQGDYVLRDLDSRNGTCLNGKKIQESRLSWGDRIQIGTTRIVFLLEEQPAPTEAQMLPNIVRKQEDPRVETMILKDRDLDPLLDSGPLGARKYIAALYDAATTLVALKDEIAVIQSLHDIVSRRFRVKNCFVLMFDLRSSQIKWRFPEIPCDAQMPLALAAMKEHSIILSRVKKGDPASTIYAPIRGSGEAHGILFVDNRDAALEFTEHHLNTLGIVGYQAGLQIENVRYLNRLRGTLEQQIAEQYEMIGSPQNLATIESFVQQAAPTEATVLVRGESGVGKELVARMIHRASPRRDHPFIVLNCAAMPKELVDSELFGHEKGAFTGASTQRKGYFEVADGSTLLLDEIGELPPEIQAKLLRAIETRTFHRVGSTEEVFSDVRLIAATHRNLSEEVAAGRFREDLFHRLNVLELVIPPLRERPSDIPILIEHWVRKLNEKMGKHIEKLDSSAMELLRGYGWPGNVRELKNTLERAIIFATVPVLTASDFPRISAEAGDHPLSLESAEREHIERILKKSGGNKAQAADLLGISRSTLYEKLEKYKLA